MLKGLHRSFVLKKDAPAQGMVEFAIVLPILLLILFGIIAFGHFFFCYSLVVAASRDAARFGAAVGLTENSIQRFRDCNMIREAAVHTGTFAGVDGTDGTVQISYDQGPKLDGSTIVYEDAGGNPVGCPVNGIGPGFIELGDRIVVTVTTTYTPIVPWVAIPEMPLTATTRRTIMLAMPVGEQPIAEQSKCVGTLTRIVPPEDSWNDALMGSTSRVGEVVPFQYETIANNPDLAPGGKLYFYVNDATYTNPACDDTAPIGICERSWNDITPLDKPHWLRARYDPGVYATTNPCYDPSKAEPKRHFVLPGDTILTIVSVEPEISEVGQEVEVVVEVRPAPPAAGTPLGPVEVYDEHGAKCLIDLYEMTYGVARGKCSSATGNPLVLNNPGMNKIIAVYDPGDPGVNPKFNSSSAAVEHQVGSNPDPDPIDQCPVFSPAAIDFATSGSSLFMTIKNTNFVNFPITDVAVTWPADPTTNLMFVNFNTLEAWSYGGETFGPPTQTVPVSNAVLQADSSSSLRLDFSSEVPKGNYTVTVTFGLGSPPVQCKPITVNGTK